MSLNVCHGIDRLCQSGVSGTVLVAFSWHLTSRLEWQLTSHRPLQHINNGASALGTNADYWYFFLYCKAFHFSALDKHSICLMWKLSMDSLFFSFCLVFFLSETKTKGLASSWRIHFGTLGTNHHGFLQNIWNQAHETRLLNSGKMIAVTATLDSLVSSEFYVFSMVAVRKCWDLGFKSSFEVISSAPISEKSNKWFSWYTLFTLSC